MMSSPLLSQTLSSDTLIAVPRIAVKNAIIVKGEFNICKEELKITQEKVVLLEDKSNKQNQLIINLNNIINTKDGIIAEKNNIIVLKEEQITILKKQKSAKIRQGLLIGFAGGAATVALLLAL